MTEFSWAVLLPRVAGIVTTIASLRWDNTEVQTTGAPMGSAPEQGMFSWLSEGLKHSFSQKPVILGKAGSQVKLTQAACAMCCCLPLSYPQGDYQHRSSHRASLCDLSAKTPTVGWVPPASLSGSRHGKLEQWVHLRHSLAVGENRLI